VAALDLELGRSAADRRAYRALFGPPLDAAFLDALRAATNGEWAFGDEGFKRQIATALTRRVAPLPKGRRRNATADGNWEKYRETRRTQRTSIPNLRRYQWFSSQIP
jgi:hypothetical protein